MALSLFFYCLVSGESKLKSSNHPNHLDSVSIERIFIYILSADTLSKQKFTFRLQLFDRISQHAIFDLFKTKIKNTFFFHLLLLLCFFFLHFSVLSPSPSLFYLSLPPFFVFYPWSLSVSCYRFSFALKKHKSILTLTKNKKNPKQNITLEFLWDFSFFSFHCVNSNWIGENFRSCNRRRLNDTLQFETRNWQRVS